MSVKGGAGVLFHHFGNESPQCCGLCMGARVGGSYAVGLESAHVADANGVCVVAQTVGARFLFGAAFCYRTVEKHNVMITDIGEASLKVPGSDIVGRHITPPGCGAAMQNNFIDWSHKIIRIRLRK